MDQAFSVFRKITKSPAVAVHGRVLTKPHIVDLMLDLAGYTGNPSVRVLDPGCGEGAFTIAAALRLVRSAGLPASLAAIGECIRAVDTDPAAVAICRERLTTALVHEGVRKAQASRLAQRWVTVDDFLEQDFGKVDLVIGNPPYVRQEGIPKAKLARYRVAFDCFYDRADLYVAFFEKGLRLLTDGGRLVFICPDRFAKNQYGKKLRALIAEQFALEYFLDLAHASPFVPEVTSYPGIFVVKRGPRPKHVEYFRLTAATPAECDYVRRKQTNHAVTYHRYDGWFSGEQKWSIESPAHLELLRRLEAEGVAIGDPESGCRVGIGVATGADSIFIVDKNCADVEADLLMPLVTTRDIITGTVKWSGQCVINPFAGDTPNLIDLRRFPRARAYFERARDRLQGRNVAQRDLKRWYRTIDRIYPSLQRQPKLLIPDIKADNLIVHEPGQLYPHHNLYYVASDRWDLHALRTILRSSIGKFFVWMYGVRMRGNFLRFQAQYLRRICLPRYQSLQKGAMKRLLAANASTRQDQIDIATAKAYRLTATDMDLIEQVAAPHRRLKSILEMPLFREAD
jgi:adenine-specific DNA-methyltransferase